MEHEDAAAWTRSTSRAGSWAENSSDLEVMSTYPDKLTNTRPYGHKLSASRSSVASSPMSEDRRDAGGPSQTRGIRTARQLAEILRRRIHGTEDELGNEKLRPGDRFPSWKALQQKYDASEKVVQNAVWSLEDEGLIVSRQGSTSYVYDPSSRTPVVLNGPCQVISRMPTLEEIDEFDIPRRAMPIFIVTNKEGNVRKYPSDRHYLDIKCVSSKDEPFE